jgi:dCTP deaminase
MLSDRKIRENLEEGRIVIDPFDDRQLGTNSYDVRLGEWYFSPDKKWDGRFVDMSDMQTSRQYWGMPILSDGRILIRALSTILAHTMEVIGGRDGITTEMQARSSIGRSGLSVCKCAGLGDVGYINRWTMEISNHTRSDLVLHVGQRVAQIKFIDLGKTEKEYQGKYSTDSWDAYSMLPKLYLDQF